MTFFFKSKYQIFCYPYDCETGGYITRVKCYFNVFDFPDCTTESLCNIPGICTRRGGGVLARWGAEILSR